MKPLVIENNEQVQSENVEEYKLEIENLTKEINNLKMLVKNISDNISRIDKTYLNDLTNLYGFNSQSMYYIGVGSGRIYHKPVDDEIVSLISRLDELDWKQIQKINQYFMK